MNGKRSRVHLSAPMREVLRNIVNATLCAGHLSCPIKYVTPTMYALERRGLIEIADTFVVASEYGVAVAAQMKRAA